MKQWIIAYCYWFLLPIIVPCSYSVKCLSFTRKFYFMTLAPVMSSVCVTESSWRTGDWWSCLLFLKLFTSSSMFSAFCTNTSDKRVKDEKHQPFQCQWQQYSTELCCWSSEFHCSLKSFKIKKDFLFSMFSIFFLILGEFSQPAYWLSFDHTYPAGGHHAQMSKLQWLNGHLLLVLYIPL